MLTLPPLFFFFPTVTAVHFYNPLKAQTHWLVSAQAFDRRRLFGQKAQYQGSRTRRASKGEPAQVFFLTVACSCLKNSHTPLTRISWNFVISGQSYGLLCTGGPWQVKDHLMFDPAVQDSWIALPP